MIEPTVIVGRINEPGTIDVTRRTPLGNPFKMHNESERDEVCDAYAEWFDAQLHEPLSAAFYQSLRAIRNLAIEAKAEGRQIVLGCHCAPKRCHANTIASWLNCQLTLHEKNTLSDSCADGEPENKGE